MPRTAFSGLLFTNQQNAIAVAGLQANERRYGKGEYLHSASEGRVQEL